MAIQANGSKGSNGSDGSFGPKSEWLTSEKRSKYSQLFQNRQKHTKDPPMTSNWMAATEQQPSGSNWMATTENWMDSPRAASRSQLYLAIIVFVKGALPKKVRSFRLNNKSPTHSRALLIISPSLFVSACSRTVTGQFVCVCVESPPVESTRYNPLGGLYRSTLETLVGICWPYAGHILNIPCRRSYDGNLHGKFAAKAPRHCLHLAKRRQWVCDASDPIRITESDLPYRNSLQCFYLFLSANLVSNHSNHSNGWNSELLRTERQLHYGNYIVAHNAHMHRQPGTQAAHILLSCGISRWFAFKSDAERETLLLSSTSDRIGDRSLAVLFAQERSIERRKWTQMKVNDRMRLRIWRS